MATGAWVSGKQPLNYTAVGQRRRQERASSGWRTRGGFHNRACALATPAGPFATPLPCPNGAGQIEVETLELAEGTQPLAVEAQDSAGNRALSAPVTARIDNTPPARVDVSVEGGEAWRNRNDWVAAWTNPAEADRAPIVAAHYELCAAGGNELHAAARSAAPDVSRAPTHGAGPGRVDAVVWRRDAAGNGEEDNASVPVTLRYDPEPPQLAFEPSEAADPTASPYA